MYSVFDILSTVALGVTVTLLVKLTLLFKTRWEFQRALKNFPEHPRGIFFLGHGKAVSIVLLAACSVFKGAHRLCVSNRLEIDDL